MLLIEVSYIQDDGSREVLPVIDNPEGAWPDIAAVLRRPAVESVVIHYDDGTEFKYSKGA